VHGKTGRVRDELAKIFVTLPRGVGAGPSGERYEHIKAISKTAAGMDALLELGMQLVRGFWDPRMRGGRLAALNKADGGIRPVLSGEALRRAVGKAMIRVAQDRIESILLPVHQMSCGSRRLLGAPT